MKHHPILMRGPLVRATLEGRKSVTRRTDLRWLKAAPGDVLYVKETWAGSRMYDTAPPRALPADARIHYLADGDKPEWAGKTRVSLFMQPRFARLWMEVVSVREEPLWDVTDDEAKREGAKFHNGHGSGHSGWRLDERDVYGTPRQAFMGIWRDIHGEASVMANPRVVRIEFKRVERPALCD